MAGFVRVECCADEATAVRRRTALEQLGFTIRVYESRKTVVRADVPANGEPEDTIICPNSVWVVVAVI